MFRTFPRTLATSVLAALLVLGPAVAEPIDPAAPPKPRSTPAASEASGKRALDHRLSPGDEIEILIVSLPELERKYKLRSDGGFMHPLLGEVQCSGMTLQDLQRHLEKRLSRELRNPAVRVGLHTLARQDVTILGEVNQPGKYEVAPGSTVLDVLAMAGGNTKDADLTTAILMRDGQSRTLSLAPPDPNATEVEQITVEPGDIMYLLPGTRISVSGDVMAPGVYALPRSASDPFHALQAAGGAKPGAALDRVVLQRASFKEPMLLDLSRPGVELPEVARVLQPGDTLRVLERQVMLLGGVQKAGPVTLQTGDNVLDVLMRGGINDPKKLHEVTIIRAEDLKAGRQKTEKHDLRPYIEKGDTSVLVPVYDGDVVYVEVPGQPGENPFNLLNLLWIGRIFGLGI